MSKFSIHNLECIRQNNMLFRGLNFSIKDGDLLQINGANGSGKSTLLKAIFGLTNIFSGSIFLNSNNIVNLSPHAIARLGLAYLPQTDNIFADLSIKDNLLMSSYTINSVDSKKRISEILNIFPILSDLYNSKAGNLSGGQRQMLAMGMSLIRKPKIMLFDEPTSNLDPFNQSEVMNLILNSSLKKPVTTIVSTHNINFAWKFNRIIMIKNGVIFKDGSPNKIINSKNLSTLYEKDIKVKIINNKHFVLTH